MKKILFSIATLAVAFGFTACSSEDEVLSNVKSGKTTVVAMTEAGTRTALSDDGAGAYDVVWSDGDQITIGDQTFTLENGAGSTTASFTGTAPADGSYTAYYATTDGTVSAIQTYAAGEISNFPMVATATVTDGEIAPLQFTNVGGILRVTLKLKEGDAARNIKKIVVSSPQLSQDIELNCPTAVPLTEEGVPFDIAMPANNYEAMTLTFYDDGAYRCVRTLASGKSLVVERSKMTNASLTAKTWEFFGLCFTASEASTVSVSSNGGTLEYLLNDGEWTEWADNTPISMASNDKVYMRRKITNAPWTGKFTGPTFAMTGSLTGSLAASGNIMSLVDRTGLSKEIPCEYCFSMLFSQCTSLTSAPELPATTLTYGCYDQMFSECTNLTTAPELPAMTLAKYCYAMMFWKCSSLATAPVLSAPILTDYCYEDMFNGCKKIKKVTCLATDISATGCLIGWLSNAAFSGTIYVAKGMKDKWAAPSRWSIAEIE